MPKKELVFDDEIDILEICEYVLERKGYSVFTRKNCTDVLKELNEVMPV